MFKIFDKMFNEIKRNILGVLGIKALLKGILFYAIIVGIVSGLGACLIYYGLEMGSKFVFHDLIHYDYPAPDGERSESESDYEETASSEDSGDFIKWLFFIMPAIGGLVSGLIVYFFAPEAAGTGNDAMIDAFHNKKGHIRFRVSPVKALASIVTLSTGGSAGREGPIAQIGAGFGVMVAKLFKLSTKERRILLLAGTAGGLGAIFRAPLGGALTSIEIIYKEDFESEALVPSVISSVIAYTIFTLIFGRSPIFGNSEVLVYTNPMELLFYVILGFGCIPIGILYTKFFYKVKNLFDNKIKIPAFFKPAIGGLLVGLTGLAVYFIFQALQGEQGVHYWGSVYSTGFGYIQEFLNMDPAPLGQSGIIKLIAAMGIIMLCKILTTSFTVATGGSGGVFGPSMFIGGMLGGVVGFTGYLFFPDIVPHPQAFIMVGMAGFFAGVANAPLATLIMICELSGGYNLILPLLLVNAIALVFTKKWSIYENQVENRFHSAAHIGNFTVDVLEQLTVAHIINKDKPVVTLKSGMTLAEFQKIYQDTHFSMFPVIDKNNRPLGIISDKEVRNALFEESVYHLIIVDEIMSPFVSVTTDYNLHEALIVFLESGYSQIPVINNDEDISIIGILDYNDLISSYHSEVVRTRDKE